jgi:hypothetical protein
MVLQAPLLVDEMSGGLGRHNLHVGPLGKLREELLQLYSCHTATHTQDDVHSASDSVIFSPSGPPKS